MAHAFSACNDCGATGSQYWSKCPKCGSENVDAENFRQDFDDGGSNDETDENEDSNRTED